MELISLRKSIPLMRKLSSLNNNSFDAMSGLVGIGMYIT